MPEERDPQSVMTLAEQAAAAGDYATAERLLGEAAELQESALGPDHPDLANTLNNLGIVCEINQKPDAAERYLRRAYGIATRSLPAEHPFVATSRGNLVAFSASRGIVFDPSTPAAAVAEVESSPPVNDPATPPAPDVPASAAQPPRRMFGPVAVAGAVVAGLLVAVFAFGPWRVPPNPPDRATNVPTDRPAPVSAAPSGDAPLVTQATRPAPPPPEPAVPAPAAPPAVTAVPPSNTTSTGPATSYSPVVSAAQLCRELVTGGSWQCVPPATPADPGPLFFLTRIKSSSDIKVQHRWYQGSRLRRTVVLSIEANTLAGYRTYSRQTVDGRGGSEWRVELSTLDGLVLHDERFSVQASPFD